MQSNDSNIILYLSPPDIDKVKLLYKVQWNLIFQEIRLLYFHYRAYDCSPNQALATLIAHTISTSVDLRFLYFPFRNPTSEGRNSQRIMLEHQHRSTIFSPYQSIPSEITIQKVEIHHERVRALTMLRNPLFPHSKRAFSFQLLCEFPPFLH